MSDVEGAQNIIIPFHSNSYKYLNRNMKDIQVKRKL